MPTRKQTRRSISMSKKTYEKLAEHCRLNTIAISAFIEKIVHERLDQVAPSELDESSPNNKETP